MYSVFTIMSYEVLLIEKKDISVDQFPELFERQKGIFKLQSLIHASAFPG